METTANKEGCSLDHPDVIALTVISRVDLVDKLTKNTSHQIRREGPPRRRARSGGGEKGEERRARRDTALKTRAVVADSTGATAEQKKINKNPLMTPDELLATASLFFFFCVRLANRSLAAPTKCERHAERIDEDVMKNSLRRLIAPRRSPTGGDLAATSVSLAGRCFALNRLDIAEWSHRVWIHASAPTDAGRMGSAAMGARARNENLEPSVTTMAPSGAGEWAVQAVIVVRARSTAVIDEAKRSCNSLGTKAMIGRALRLSFQVVEMAERQDERTAGVEKRPSRRFVSTTTEQTRGTANVITGDDVHLNSYEQDTQPKISL
ncbi:hypothetical protein BIW11_03213 [Tropilaelaps mercedesae]|uniref:Uncharacterized protein n=1 Tax=Tropilaelaps mercedesae TaxID=418985 RepID=A0A1V9XQB0_9ACAR|nr:hypothetical protein BIW11_03213 [Tropilaelaps mercedesae]